MLFRSGRRRSAPERRPPGGYAARASGFLHRLAGHRLGDAFGQGQRPFQLAQQRQDHQEVREVVQRGHPRQHDPDALGLVGAADAQHDEGDGPDPDTGGQQADHDQLDDKVGVQEQTPQRQVAARHPQREAGQAPGRLQEAGFGFQRQGSGPVAAAGVVVPPAGLLGKFFASIVSLSVSNVSLSVLNVKLTASIAIFCFSRVF